jgi:uncharacterized protein YpmS
MNHRTIKLITGLSVIFLTLLACNLPTNQSIQKNSPQVVTVAATEVVQNPTTDPSTTGSPNSSNVTYTVTESQLTTTMTEKMSQQSEMTLQNPQVLLRDGQIQITGQYTQSFLTVPVNISMVPEIDANGRLNIRVTSAELGSVQAPQSFTDSLSSTINDNLASAYNPSEAGVRVTNVTIADGIMTITGTQQ